MGSYKYVAINKFGETVTGRIEASQETSVVERLRGLSLVATEIKEVRQSSLFGTTKAKASVKIGELSLFSRQLAAMLNAGIPITRALFTLSKQVSNKGFGKAIEEIAQNIEGGASFSESLKGYPKLFSALYVNMIQSGETGGTLETSLIRLSVQLQKAKELRDNIRSATFYPLVVMMFAFAVLFGMLFFLVPVFVGFFPEGTQLPLPTRVIIGMSDLVRNLWFIVFPLLIALFVGLRAYVRSPAGKKRIDSVSFRLPIFGPLVQKSVIASFARTFSTLLSSGIAVVQALEASGAASGHTLVSEASKRAGEKIQEGSSVAVPLEESGIFPPMVVQMVAVGEETGDIPEMMDKVAVFYEEEVATMTKGLTSLVEPLMLIVVGILVGGMLVALYLPIFTVITQI